jgi:hypothetical protein
MKRCDFSYEQIKKNNQCTDDDYNGICCIGRVQR